MDIDPGTQGTSLAMKLVYFLATLTVGFIISQVWLVFIKPLKDQQFYKKQGIPCEFTPLTGTHQSCLDEVIKYGDSEHYYKTLNGREKWPLKCGNTLSDVSITIRDTALIKEFCLNPHNYIKDPLFLGLFFPLVGYEGLALAEGEKWKRQRRHLTQVFNFENLKQVIPIAQYAVGKRFEELKAGSLKEVDIMRFFQNTIGMIVGRFFFGELMESYSLGGTALTSALVDLASDIGRINFSDKFKYGNWFINKGFFPRHRQVRTRINLFRGLILEITSKKREQFENRTKESASASAGKAKNIIDLLFELTYNDGAKVDDVELVDQFITFYVEGVDTTSHLVTIALYYLKIYPEYMKRALDEVKTHFGGDKEITMDTVNKLDFVMAFLKECLRTMTPVPALFPRRVVKDHDLGQYKIKKGTIVELDFFYTQFHPDFFPNPEKFDPDRWTGANAQKGLDSYAFTPFSAGPRNCIGQHFSMMEARMLISKFLLTFDYEIIEGFKLRMHSTFLYEAVDKIKFNLKLKDQ